MTRKMTFQNVSAVLFALPGKSATGSTVGETKRPHVVPRVIPYGVWGWMITRGTNIVSQLGKLSACD